MAKKKSFISGLDNLIENNIEDIKEISVRRAESNLIIGELQQTDLDTISDDKLKWLLSKMVRYKNELKLWRTGRMTIDKFHQSLEEEGLKYNIDINEIEEL